MEDTKILDLYFERNEDAIRQTDVAYGKKLHCLANNILHNSQDSEESVNDTYMKAWDTIPPQRPAYFYAYLAKICRHFALGKLDWKTATKRKAEIVSLTSEMALCIPDTSTETTLDAKEVGDTLNVFLENLTRKPYDFSKAILVL